MNWNIIVYQLFSMLASEKEHLQFLQEKEAKQEFIEYCVQSINNIEQRIREYQDYLKKHNLIKSSLIQENSLKSPKEYERERFSIIALKLDYKQYGTILVSNKKKFEEALRIFKSKTYENDMFWLEITSFSSFEEDPNDFGYFDMSCVSEPNQKKYTYFGKLSLEDWEKNFFDILYDLGCYVYDIQINTNY